VEAGAARAGGGPGRDCGLRQDGRRDDPRGTGRPEAEPREARGRRPPVPRLRDKGREGQLPPDTFKVKDRWVRKPGYREKIKAKGSKFAAKAKPKAEETGEKIEAKGREVKAAAGTRGRKVVATGGELMAAADAKGSEIAAKGTEMVAKGSEVPSATKEKAVAAGDALAAFARKVLADAAAL
jgi:hypothetical protein